MTAEAGWTVLREAGPGQQQHIVSDLTDATTAARLAAEREAEDTLNGRNGRYRAVPVGDPDDTPPSVPEPPDEWSCPDYHAALGTLPGFRPPPVQPWPALNIDPHNPLDLRPDLPPGVGDAVRDAWHDGTLHTYQPGVPSGQNGDAA